MSITTLPYFVYRFGWELTIVFWEFLLSNILPSSSLNLYFLGTSICSSFTLILFQLCIKHTARTRGYLRVLRLLSPGNNAYVRLHKNAYQLRKLFLNQRNFFKGRYLLKSQNVVWCSSSIWFSLSALLPFSPLICFIAFSEADNSLTSPFHLFMSKSGSFGSPNLSFSLSIRNTYQLNIFQLKSS